jgi:hypothetical protein
VFDFRAPSVRLQLLMGFGPVRLPFILLLPTDEGGFIAPFEQLSHGLAVCSGQHKSFMADSVAHTVRVQNVLSLSRSNDVATFPCDCLA